MTFSSMIFLEFFIIAPLLFSYRGSQPKLHRNVYRNFQLQSSLDSSAVGLENPMTDKISVKHFHHVEFYCGDATNTYKRFLLGLGMELVSKSDQSTGNTKHASYVLQSGEMKMVFTAPYSSTIANPPVTITDGQIRGNNAVKIDSGNIVPDTTILSARMPFPSFDSDSATDFFSKHGFGVKSVAIEVSDLTQSYDVMIQNGAVSRLKPCKITDKDEDLGSVEYAEVALYGDVILRLVNSEHYKGKFLPHFEDVIVPLNSKRKQFDYGIEKFDHIVEFTTAVVGTVDSGLNSVVLANNNEMVLMPINEPTFGTKRKSQIQTYLEQNNGEGVQHMALFTSDIFATLEQMRDASHYGGFEFMDRQGDQYYRNLPSRLGDSLTQEQYKRVKELGILADKDNNGVLLQIFTKPVGDRPTLFLEIIQRLGCPQPDGRQKPGCGGFGKGNFKDLFQSIEDYEKTLSI